MRGWKSLARCAESLLVNVAAIGIGLGFYKQEWWPAAAIGFVTGALALIIAWRVGRD